MTNHWWALIKDCNDPENKMEKDVLSDKWSNVYSRNIYGPYPNQESAWEKALTICRDPFQICIFFGPKNPTNQDFNDVRDLKEEITEDRLLPINREPKRKSNGK